MGLPLLIFIFSINFVYNLFLIHKMGLYKRFVEVGRVCLINYGPNKGKLCVVIDVIDTNRVLIDGPSTHNGVKRQAMNLKRLALTSIVITFPRGARVATVTKAFNKAEVQKKFDASKWGQRLTAKAKKEAMTDFELHAAKMEKKQKK